MSFVVTGATGQVGSAVVDYLLAQSLPVRVVIRDKKKAASFQSRHIEVVVADLTDVEALSKAFQGAKAVFAMNPPDPTSSDLQTAAVKVSQAIASAVQTAKVERLVVLSSIGAERSSKTGNILTTHTLEEALKGTAPQVVMVRAGSFMENWLGSIAPVKSGQSPVLGSTFQKLDKTIPHIAANDIGRVVAEYMTKPTSEVDKLVIIELEGPEDYTPNDVAKVVSDVLGKPVPAVALDEATMRDMFGKFGWTKTTLDNYIEMMQGFDDNTIRWTTGEGAIRIKGKLTLADVLKKN